MSHDRLYASRHNQNAPRRDESWLELNREHCSRESRAELTQLPKDNHILLSSQAQKVNAISSAAPGLPPTPTRKRRREPEDIIGSQTSCGNSDMQKKARAGKALRVTAPVADATETLGQEQATSRDNSQTSRGAKIDGAEDEDADADGDEEPSPQKKEANPEPTALLKRCQKACATCR